MLTYSFIFEPNELWANRYMFEGSLANMFAKNGIEVEQVQTPAKKNGEVEIKVLLLEPKKEIEVNEETQKVPSIKQIKADLQKKRGYDGKFTNK